MKNFLTLTSALLISATVGFAEAPVSAEKAADSSIFLKKDEVANGWTASASLKAFIDNVMDVYAKIGKSNNAGTPMYILGADDGKTEGAAVICLSKSTVDKKIYRIHSADRAQNGSIEAYDKANGTNHAKIFNDEFLKTPKGTSISYNDGGDAVKEGIIIANLNDHALCFARGVVSQ